MSRRRRNKNCIATDPMKSRHLISRKRLHDNKQPSIDHHYHS